MLLILIPCDLQYNLWALYVPLFILAQALSELSTFACTRHAPLWFSAFCRNKMRTSPILCFSQAQDTHPSEFFAFCRHKARTSLNSLLYCRHKTSTPLNSLRFRRHKARTPLNSLLYCWHKARTPLNSRLYCWHKARTPLNSRLYCRHKTSTPPNSLLFCRHKARTQQTLSWRRIHPKKRQTWGGTATTKTIPLRNHSRLLYKARTIKGSRVDSYTEKEGAPLGPWGGTATTNSDGFTYEQQRRACGCATGDGLTNRQKNTVF